jgi:hypothetical protein
VKGLLALAGGELPRAAEVTLDRNVLAFALGITLCVGLIVSIAPIWRALRGGVSGVLREGGRAVAGGSHARLRRGLVIAEVAVALMLVVGAGLMSRSFLALVNVDAGFHADLCWQCSSRLTRIVIRRRPIQPVRRRRQVAISRTTRK